MLTEEERLQVQKWEEASMGARVTGQGDIVWRKDADGLWHGGGAIRVNAIALLSYSKEFGREAQEEPEVKLKKGVEASMPTLFG